MELHVFRLDLTRRVGALKEMKDSLNIIKKLRWQILIIVLALIVIAVVLWGQQAEPVLVEAPEPTSGGLYTEGIVGSLMRLNPLLAVFNPPDQDPSNLLYSGLIQFDSTGLPQPDLSNSWGISRDGNEIGRASCRERV